MVLVFNVLFVFGDRGVPSPLFIARMYEARLHVRLRELSVRLHRALLCNTELFIIFV
jgi:hypothetical protein